MKTVTQLPVARPDADFLIEALDHETLVYDQRTNRAHCLDARASMVWRLCDGTRTLAQIADGCSAAGLPCSVAEVSSAIEQLNRTALLQPTAAPARRSSVDRSRRRFVRKAVVAGAVVAASPVIFSIVAPSVAEAASTACGTTGKVCTGATGTRGTCCAGHICISGHCT